MLYGIRFYRDLVKMKIRSMLDNPSSRVFAKNNCRNAKIKIMQTFGLFQHKTSHVRALLLILIPKSPTKDVIWSKSSSIYDVIPVPAASKKNEHLFGSFMRLIYK
jgi:hypothetical protein